MSSYNSQSKENNLGINNTVNYSNKKSFFNHNFKLNSKREINRSTWKVKNSPIKVKSSLIVKKNKMINKQNNSKKCEIITSITPINQFNFSTSRKLIKAPSLPSLKIQNGNNKETTNKNKVYESRKTLQTSEAKDGHSVNKHNMLLNINSASVNINKEPIKSTKSSNKTNINNKINDKGISPTNVDNKLTKISLNKRGVSCNVFKKSISIFESTKDSVSGTALKLKASLINNNNNNNLKPINNNYLTNFNFNSTNINNTKPTSSFELVSSPNTILNPQKKFKVIYHYIIKPGNCGYLIKKCFEHRLNWKELDSSSDEDVRFNLKWQPTTAGLEFGSLSKFGSVKQLVNHFENHYCISNKANLFINLLKYAETKDKNVFQYIPFTILFSYYNENFITRFAEFTDLFSNIKDYIFDYYLLDSLRHGKTAKYITLFPFFDRTGNKTPVSIPNTHYNEQNLWLIKAPDLNRGMCIRISNRIDKIRKYVRIFSEGILKGYADEDNEECYNNNYDDNNYNSNNNNNYAETSSNGQMVYNQYKSKIVIIQKYIEKPLLYYGRKFDIRIWVLLTHKMQVYAFKEGHLKTCSVSYKINSSDNYVHITNYSYQKHNNNFSKYEFGNEVSFQQLQSFLDKEVNSKTGNGSQINFKFDIYPKIEEIIELVFQSVRYKINAFDRQYCFEIFGFDFMIDEKYNPFLIEVNTNPGLEESSPLIKMLVPRMIDDALRLTIDDLFKTSYSFNEGDKSLDVKMPYMSPFPVIGYANTENLWDFICDLTKDDNNQKNKIKMKFRVYNRKLKK